MRTTIKLQIDLTDGNLEQLRRVMDAEQLAFPDRAAKTEMDSLRDYIRRHVDSHLFEILDVCERYYLTLAKFAEEVEETEEESQ